MGFVFQGHSNISKEKATQTLAVCSSPEPMSCHSTHCCCRKGAKAPRVTCTIYTTTTDGLEEKALKQHRKQIFCSASPKTPSFHWEQKSKLLYNHFLLILTAPVPSASCCSPHSLSSSKSAFWSNTDILKQPRDKIRNNFVAVFPTFWTVVMSNAPGTNLKWNR